MPRAPVQCTALFFAKNGQVAPRSVFLVVALMRHLRPLARLYVDALVSVDGVQAVVRLVKVHALNSVLLPLAAVSHRALFVGRQKCAVCGIGGGGNHRTSCGSNADHRCKR